MHGNVTRFMKDIPGMYELIFIYEHRALSDFETWEKSLPIDWAGLHFDTYRANKRDQLDHQWI